MRAIRHLMLTIISMILSLNISYADITDVTDGFNNSILEKDSFDFPYLETRNDIGVFYDFTFNQDQKKIMVKRNNNGYPVVRFSLFDKKNIIPGDVVISYNDIDLSKVDDEKIIILHKRNNVANLKILNKTKTIKANSYQYKLNDIKLANFYLNFINTIDTTKGVLEISFRSTFTNKKPELDKYAKGILDDEIYYINDDLYNAIYLPIDNVVYNEYKYDVDIRQSSRPEFSFDNGTLRTFKAESGIAQFRQKFDFNKFPFDTQKLKIEILSGAFSTSDPSINWPKGTASVTFVTPDKGAFLGLYNYQKKNILKEMGWTIVSTDIVSKEIIEEDFYDAYLDKIHTSSENSINLIIEIKRNSAHYLFKIIIPVFLILCVAWSVLWIPTYKLDARLTTSIVALLSLIAYNFVFEGDIPKLDYLTDLDKYILLSYIFCCIPTFISIGFSRFIQRTAKMQRRVTKVNAHIRKWGGVIYLLITFQIFYSVN